MRTNPVTVYETKPATEWILGGPVQKVSPRYAHGVLQRVFAAELGRWATGRGRTAVEWRFWLTPPGEESRYLVPDVAYLSYDKLPREAIDAAQEPRTAPDVAAEILSPSDRAAHVEHKIAVYLACGTAVVIVVDPQRRAVRTHDRAGFRDFEQTDRLEHASLPGFSLPLDDFFSNLDR